MWTSTALASEHAGYRGTVWRIVEAQHRISTNRLAGSLQDQADLELLADEVKPSLPRSAWNLAYLLASPFRYGHRFASRFRSANTKPGIFYASESETTALTEAAFWRLKFYANSPSFRAPNATIEHTSFKVAVNAPRALDLSKPPFAQFQAQWTAPDDYKFCQNFAEAARKAGTQALRTMSARHPGGYNIVIFEPSAFAERSPHHDKTWHLRFEEGRLVAFAAFPHNDQLEFTTRQFGLP